MGYEPHVSELDAEAQRVSETKLLLASLGVDDFELVDATIESETNFKEAIDAKARAIYAYETLIAAAEAQAKRIKDRAARLEKTVEGWRGEIATALEKAGEKRIVTATQTVSIKAGSASFEVIDPAKVPAKFFVREIDKPALKKEAVAWAKKLREIEEIKDDAERTKAVAAHLKIDPTKGGGKVTWGRTSVTFYRN